MHKKQIQHIHKIVEKNLIKEEKIISTSLAKNGHSYYLSIFRPPNGIKNLRISDHPTVKNYQIFPKIFLQDDWEKDLERKISYSKRKKLGNYISVYTNHNM